MCDITSLRNLRKVSEFSQYYLEIGKLIQKSLAGREVGLTLELGGKAANIVYEDAAIDQAVEGVVNGIFFNQGHVCCAGSRLFVQENVADKVIRKLKPPESIRRS